MKKARDSGQALVQVAALIVMLLLVSGVVLDYGMVLSLRREMQNAADAGALAGAREICFGERSNAVNSATTYALANGADAPVTVEIRDSAGAEDPLNGYIVGVETQRAGRNLVAWAGWDRHIAGARQCCGSVWRRGRRVRHVADRLSAERLAG